MLIEAAIERLYEKGLENGFKMGMDIGKVLQQMKAAGLMLENGEPIQKIKRYTGLSTEGVKRLKVKLMNRKS